MAHAHSTRLFFFFPCVSFSTLFFRQRRWAVSRLCWLEFSEPAYIRKRNLSVAKYQGFRTVWWKRVHRHFYLCISPCLGFLIFINCILQHFGAYFLFSFDTKVLAGGPKNALKHRHVWTKKGLRQVTFSTTLLVKTPPILYGVQPSLRRQTAPFTLCDPWFQYFFCAVLARFSPPFPNGKGGEQLDMVALFQRSRTWKGVGCPLHCIQQKQSRPCPSHRAWARLHGACFDYRSRLACIMPLQQNTHRHMAFVETKDRKTINMRSFILALKDQWSSDSPFPRSRLTDHNPQKQHSLFFSTCLLSALTQSQRNESCKIRLSNSSWLYLPILSPDFSSFPVFFSLLARTDIHFSFCCWFFADFLHFVGKALSKPSQVPFASGFIIGRASQNAENILAAFRPPSHWVGRSEEP